MATRSTHRPRSRSELRALGVPEDVIERVRRRDFTGPHRYDSTLAFVAIDGKRVEDQAADLREILRARVSVARARHGLD